MRTFDFTPLFRSTVGFDRLFDLVDGYAEQGYPPYNIERSDDTHYRITLAVAGFGEKDLNLEVREGVLTVTGKREAAENAEAKGYLYQGIAGRSFERGFQLAEHVEVREARARERPAAYRTGAADPRGEEASQDRDQRRGSEAHRGQEGGLTGLL